MPNHRRQIPVLPKQGKREGVHGDRLNDRGLDLFFTVGSTAAGIIVVAKRGHHQTERLALM